MKSGDTTVLPEGFVAWDRTHLNLQPSPYSHASLRFQQAEETLAKSSETLSLSAEAVRQACTGVVALGVQELPPELRMTFLELTNLAFDLSENPENVRICAAKILEIARVLARY